MKRCVLKSVVMELSFFNSSSFLLLSFCFPGSSENVLSGAGIVSCIFTFSACTCAYCMYYNNYYLASHA